MEDSLTTSWTVWMFLWIGSGHDVTLDQRLCDKWQVATNNPSQEFERIEQANRESKVYHGSSRVLMKRLLFSKWSEVLIEIRKEASTMLQFGCHARKGKGFELFR